MKSEIVMIGTELLLGQIVDTNAAYLARQLAAGGIDVFRKTTVGDNARRIADILTGAMDRCDIVITSGGLGPTVDDKTREAVSLATGRPLILNPALLDAIAAFFERRGIELGENNKRQAYIPDGALPIENPVGTAPGFIVEKNGKSLISLPGVPRELYFLMEKTVLPYLKERFRIQTVLLTRVLRTAGVGESTIDRMIADLEESDNPTVGLSAHPGSVDIRIAAKAESVETAAGLLDAMEARIRDRLGDAIFGIDAESIEQVVVQRLRKRGLKLAVLETNTSGIFTARLTEAENGSGAFSSGRIVPLKAAGAGLAEGSTVSAPSKELAERLSEHLLAETGADIAVAIVGDDDPAVGPFQKVTGQTHIGIAARSKPTVCRHIRIGGICPDARTRIASFAFEALRRCI